MSALLLSTRALHDVLSTQLGTPQSHVSVLTLTEHTRALNIVTTHSLETGLHLSAQAQHLLEESP